MVARKPPARVRTKRSTVGGAAAYETRSESFARVHTQTVAYSHQIEYAAEGTSERKRALRTILGWVGPADTFGYAGRRDRSTVSPTSIRFDLF
jgi:hypothetical protein